MGTVTLMSKILIKNGRVWDGEKFYFADVLADNGKISKIGEIIDEPVNSATDFVFDAKDKIVSAGFVDLHMHMRGVSSVTFGTISFIYSKSLGCCILNTKKLVH